jgi:Mg2+/Co2+ transporter CorB
LESQNPDVVDEQNMWGIVKGTEKSLADPNKLLEWQSRDDKAKAIIGLALSGFELYHIDLEISSKVI